MLKRNIVSELVKKFTEALKKIEKLKTCKKYGEALDSIDSVLKDVFRLSVKFFNSLSDENILDMVNTNDILDTDRCIIIAKLLKEEADIFEAQGRLNESFSIYLKSLYLYIKAFKNQNDAELLTYLSDIDLILEKVVEFKLPNNQLNEIIDYYTEIACYDKAENFLYELLDENNYSPETIEKGIYFYNELLKKDPEDLEKGNLPFEEVKSGLEHLKKQ